MFFRDVDRSRVRPTSSTRSERLQLKAEFVGRPDIIIIQERDPFSRRLCYPAVAGCTLSNGDIVPQQAHSRIGHGSNHLRGAIRGSFVDHNHFQPHATLIEHAGHGQLEEAAAVARRNDYRDLGPVG
jgi:hypothetical protein